MSRGASSPSACRTRTSVMSVGWTAESGTTNAATASTRPRTAVRTTRPALTRVPSRRRTRRPASGRSCGSGTAGRSPSPCASVPEVVNARCTRAVAARAVPATASRSTVISRLLTVTPSMRSPRSALDIRSRSPRAVRVAPVVKPGQDRLKRRPRVGAADVRRLEPLVDDPGDPVHHDLASRLGDPPGHGPGAGPGADRRHGGLGGRRARARRGRLRWRPERLRPPGRRCSRTRGRASARGPPRRWDG